MSRDPVTALDHEAPSKRASMHVTQSGRPTGGRMDNEPEQNAAPTALDKVTAALAALGQDTAAAIAQRAGVGYSTATKRLRVLEEAGQAETFRADDGRTLWRQPASTAGSGSADTPATTTDDPPHTPEPDTAPHDNPEQPAGTPAPAPDADTTAAAEPKDESTGNPPDEVRRPASEVAADPPAPQDTPSQPGGDQSDAVAPDPAGEGGEPVTTVSVEQPAAVEASEAKRGRDPGLASAHDHLPAGGQAEAPDTAGAQARRSKGSLRGAIRDVLEAHPDQTFKTSQLCRAIDAANEGSGSAKASAGAVVNAVHKLVAAGIAVQVADRPATFQLAPTTD
ncbi:MarR family transcriptional regulator [Micromonospora carbonacea]|uniref:winged helix-turn-helix domain-containing protein n=1 Tax=Micromonospora carbonacea TaxID=47853 RepID=UPI003D993ACB